MFMLIIALITIIFNFNKKKSVSIIISFIVLSPIILFAIFCILAFKQYIRLKRKDGTLQNDDSLQEKTKKMMSRLTKSQRDLFKTNINISNNNKTVDNTAKFSIHDEDDDDDEEKNIKVEMGLIGKMKQNKSKSMSLPSNIFKSDDSLSSSDENDDNQLQAISPASVKL